MKNDAVPKAAFIIKDAKSYVDAEEAWFHLQREFDKAILFVVIPRGYFTPEGSVRKKEIKDVIDKKKWSEIIWISTFSNNLVSSFKIKMRKNRLLNAVVRSREYGYNLIDRIKLDKVAKKYQPCKIVVSGHKNTQEHLAAKLNPEKLYLVDAGLSVLKRISHTGYIDCSVPFRMNSFRKILLKLTGLKVFKREKTTLFSAYADQLKTKHNVEKNTQEYKKNQIKNTETGEDVIWISSPIHEMIEGVTIQSYVNYMKESLERLNIDGSKLIYIPHARKENPDDIKFIEESIGCRVDGRLLPVEVKVAHRDKLPRTCISPLSSALINLEVLAEGKIKMISAWHYEFNCFRNWVNWRKNVENNSEFNIQFFEIEDCVPLFGIDSEDCKKASVFKDFQDWQVRGKSSK